jgi:putative transposase
VSEKYEFIAAEYARNQVEDSAGAPTLTQMLSWLAVSKSGFYEWVCHERGGSVCRQSS